MGKGQIYVLDPSSPKQQMIRGLGINDMKQEATCMGHSQVEVDITKGE